MEKNNLPAKVNNWNTANTISVNCTKGHSYQITNVNWMYQWDNQEHKWYSATINTIK